MNGLWIQSAARLDIIMRLSIILVALGWCFMVEAPLTAMDPMRGGRRSGERVSLEKSMYPSAEVPLKGRF